MIIPELPDYLTQLGGADYKGLIISLFTLTAMLSRPFSGKLTDKIGRIPVMVFGSSVCFVVSLMYPLISTVSGFLLLRFLHGMSTGFKPTGTAAYVADLVPAHKRGEAMGLLGVFTSTGMALGPSIGGWIALEYSINTLFYISAVLGLLSVLVLIGMKETHPSKEKFKVSMLRIKPHEFFEPRAIPPSLVMLLTSFSFGIVLTIIPDLSTHLGIENKGLFFSVYVVASLLVRFFAGKISDRVGRVKVLLFSTVLSATALFVVGISEGIEGVLAGGFILGIALGMNNPTIFAWTVDLSDPQFRGRAMSTMYIALEIGIGSGAFISAWIYNNDASRFMPTFWMGSVFSIIAFVYLLIWKNSKKKVTHE